MGLKVILFTVRSAFIAPRTFFECEGSRLGGTAMVYNVFSKIICILVMAEGGDVPIDETTEKTPLPDTGNDDDDNIDWEALVVLDPEEPERTQPFEPGGASTPYPEGEEHEMTNLPQEQTGMVHGPGEPAWNSLTFIYPDASATDLEAFYDPKTQRLKVKMAGSGKTSYYLYTEDKVTKTEKLNPKLTREIRKALGKSTLDKVRVLQQERESNRRAIVEKTNRKKQLEEAAQEVQETRRQEMDALRNQTRQLDEEIRELEDKAGPLDEEAIQRLKDEKRRLKKNTKGKGNSSIRLMLMQRQHSSYKSKSTTSSLLIETLKGKSINLASKCANPWKNYNKRKPLLKRDLLKRVLEDENASASEREAAQKEVEQDERALERVNEDVEREEQKLPLRERVKNIFKKYGWTLQAVALAVGIVLSALALAATNGLKAGTKAIGNGLKTIGQKLGSLLPGLIGSIVSYIFKAAGQVFSFLAEHAWLLILAVVAFFMERMLKRRRR